jgi:hypothetical protein
LQHQSHAVVDDDKRLGAQDNVIEGILCALRELTALPLKRQRRIGFTAPLDDAD